MAVRTSRVRGRRVLRLTSIDDVLRDAEAMVALGPRLRTLGNWSAGQILDHIAAFIEQSVNGFDTRAPWVVRAVARLGKPLVLKRTMRPGLPLPKRFASLQPRPAISTDEGLGRLRGAVELANARGMTQPSPILGPMTHEDWQKLHSRHAEMHCSFMVEGSAA